MKRFILLLLLLPSLCFAGPPAGFLDVDTDGNLPVIVTDASDSTTNALIVITYEHHELHAGDSFVVNDVQSVDTTTMKWQITTPDSTKYAHMLFDIACTGEMYVVVTEGSDKTDGTALAEINRRRVGTPNTATTIVTRTPTDGATDGAVTIMASRVGSTGVGNKTLSGGSERGNNEYIL